MSIAPVCTCDGCGTAIEPSRGNRPRRWCSERCRKRTLYAGECEHCGARTDGSNGRGPNAARLCTHCNHDEQIANAVWTRERILHEGQRWYALTGRWPLTGDWNRYQNKGERRELIDRYHELTGPWPHVQFVQQRFGSWRAFIHALGGEAQPEHDGAPGLPRRGPRSRCGELRALIAAAEFEARS